MQCRRFVKKATPQSCRSSKTIVVVERRLILKEEVHIRRVQVTEHHRETVMVRQQDAVITRNEAGKALGETTAGPRD
jgi:hypothetical protein